MTAKLYHCAKFGVSEELSRAHLKVHAGYLDFLQALIDIRFGTRLKWLQLSQRKDQGFNTGSSTLKLYCSFTVAPSQLKLAGQ